ncbi:hypothetical protein GALL_443370 [mine drainage metagenome]|uniref:Uncharacterized protein n=1 Tax=mine drainage metagenome TaxID=410659 RepID=A0A1J5Q951_9ZZZZ
MGHADTDITKQLQITRAHFLEGAHETGTVPVNITQIGACGGIAKVSIVHRWCIKNVHAPVPLQPDAQRVSVNRNQGDAHHVSVFKRIAGGRAVTALKTAAITKLGIGTGQGINFGGVTEGHAVKRVVDQQRWRATIARAQRGVVLDVAGRAAGGRTPAHREPHFLVGNVAPGGVNTVHVKVAAGRHMAERAIKNTHPVSKERRTAPIGDGAVVLRSEHLVHLQLGRHADILRGFGTDVQAKTVGHQAVVFGLVGGDGGGKCAHALDQACIHGVSQKCSCLVIRAFGSHVFLELPQRRDRACC